MMRTLTLVGILCAVAHARAEGRLGTTTSYTVAHVFRGEQTSVVTSELAGEVAVARGLWISGTLPLARVWAAHATGTAIGNVTAGLRLVRGDALQLTFTADLSLPTASKAGNGGMASSEAASVHYLDGFGRYEPLTSSLDVTAGLRYAGGAALAYAVAGHRLHVFHLPSRWELLELIRLTLGAGLRLGAHGSLVGEITTVADYLEERWGHGDHLYHAATVALRHETDRFVVAAALTLPLDDELRRGFSPSLGLELARKF